MGFRQLYFPLRVLLFQPLQEFLVGCPVSPHGGDGEILFSGFGGACADLQSKGKLFVC